MHLSSLILAAVAALGGISDAWPHSRDFKIKICASNPDWNGKWLKYTPWTAATTHANLCPDSDASEFYTSGSTIWYKGDSGCDPLPLRISPPEVQPFGAVFVDTRLDGSQWWTITGSGVIGINGTTDNWYICPHTSVPGSSDELVALWWGNIDTESVPPLDPPIGCGAVTLQKDSSHGHWHGH
ncbi:hypothetical protein ABW21_db0208308 [Orbilia brochopaga]|nr:hypothetical protein ABW21_db0208308 [Drechslerella brochopaga]